MTLPSKNIVAAGASGLIFALGLGISGMTEPARVIGFLDVAGGRWDPTLALVMIGAIAVHLPAYRWLSRVRAGRPTAAIHVKARAVLRARDASGDDGPGVAPHLSNAVDARLVAGAAVFGVGWGLAGYCPGPALVTLVTLSPGILVFLASLMTGMWIYHVSLDRDPAPPPGLGLVAGRTPARREPNRRLV